MLVNLHKKQSGYRRVGNTSVAIKPSKSDHVFNVVVDAFLIVLLVIIAVPLWSTITLSFRPNDYIGNNLQGMFLVQIGRASCRERV